MMFCLAVKLRGFVELSKSSRRLCWCIKIRRFGTGLGESVDGDGSESRIV